MPACPYHPAGEVRLPGGEGGAEGAGPARIGWLQGCCGLVAWRCPHGVLQPQEARYCTVHGCPAPAAGSVPHEIGQIPVPPPVVHPLERRPDPTGRSTPALAGNVLAYLAEAGEVVVADLGGGATVSLIGDIGRATLRIVDGTLLAALSTPRGVRRLAWRVRDLRDALDGRIDPPEGIGVEVSGLYPEGLPRSGERRRYGAGPLRVDVEHDPVPDDVARIYLEVTGASAGRYLIWPRGSARGIRPQLLHQIPVAIPGGTLILGRLRDGGQTAQGATLMPTVLAHV